MPYVNIKITMEEQGGWGEETLLEAWRLLRKHQALRQDFPRLLGHLAAPRHSPSLPATKRTDSTKTSSL